MEAMNVAGIRFSFNDLSIMTDEFSEDNTIVKSEHFTLFRAKIEAQVEDAEKEEVTVKIWHSSEKLARFREEITILGHARVINCPNIANLMGYCCEGENVGTVYTLQSVDTLENLLDEDGFQWRARMITALGIARIFCFIDLRCSSPSIHATLPCYVILDQGSNPVLCDVQGLAGGIMLREEGDENSSIGNDASLFSEDVTAGKMRQNGIFALGRLLLRLIRNKRHVFEDVTKLPYVGTLTCVPSYSQLKSQSFFYQCDYYSVSGLADQCLDHDEKCLTVSQVVQKLENLLLFSLPVRTSSGKVVVGECTLVYFTYSDLCELTDNFSLENLFAITGFGEAYRGRIQPGWKEAGAQDIVVKMWGEVNFSRRIRDGKKSALEDDICRLRDEVYLLTQRWMIDNPNVVKLLGYCFEDKKVGAVYGVQPLYTLESLFDDEWFEWKDRIVATLELARTLVLFHGKEYVLCNISGAHIMIDQDKKPILYDFSMLHGQVLSGKRAARSLHQISTIDYLDPYLLQTSLVVPQSDIFAFGALLLSLICKRDMCLVIRSFIYKHVEDRYKSKSSLVHESFLSHPSFDHNDGGKLIALAMACLGQDCVLSRPSASDIVDQLQSLSLFSDSLFSNDVKTKVIDLNYTNKGRKPSWQKYLRLFRRLSITRDKHREWKGKKISGNGERSRRMSSPESAKQKGRTQGPMIIRPLISEVTPEEICSCIQLIDASLKQEHGEYERRRELQKNKNGLGGKRE